MELTKQQIFMALAKQVPDKDGKLVDNPNKMWSDIDASLPAEKIEVLGPPPTSGTRDSFMELAMEVGAGKFKSLEELKKADAKAFEAVWKSMREDGAYVEAGENDNLIVQKLQANPAALGIFGFSFLEENASTIKGIEIDGVAPTYETDCLRRLQDVAPALHLCQEAACWCRSRHGRICGRVCFGQGLG